MRAPPTGYVAKRARRKIKRFTRKQLMRERQRREAERRGGGRWR